MQTCPICYSYSLDWDLTDSGEPCYLPMEILRCSHCGESDPDSKRYIDEPGILAGGALADAGLLNQSKAD